VRHPDVAANAAGEFLVNWSQPGSASPLVGRRLGEAPVPCMAAPKAGCREPTAARKGIFRFKQGPTPARSTLTWRWLKGAAAGPEDFGDPFHTHSYAFCVYDSSATAQPLIGAAVPAGGACGALPCWSVLSGERVNYFDKIQFVGGMRLIQMAPGIVGSARALVQARGEDLVLPTMPLAPPVTVQLQVANGECWTASYDAFIKQNIAGAFRAQPDPG
jgi:hypothetical protein